jgi:aminopeptidase N
VVVYVQGDNYLEAYRQQVGNDLFWQGVRQYFNDYEFKLGGTRKLWDSLDQVSGFTGGHADRFPTLYP